jgi:hypothetical protein
MMAGFNGYTAVPGEKVGPGGSIIKQIKIYQPVLSPAGIGAGISTEQTFSVTGLATDDIVVGVSKPTAQANLGIVGWRVSAANVLALQFSNTTGGTVSPTGSETYSVFVVSPYAL